MKYFSYFHLLPLLVFISCQPTGNTSDGTAEEQFIGEIRAVTPALASIIDTTAKIQILGEGFTWGEGPAWIPSQNKLLFSDVPENIVYSWDSIAGIDTFLSPSGFTGETTNSTEPGANGLSLDLDGRLLLCQHGDRRIARWEGSWENPVASYSTVAGRYDDNRFNSPNDLVVASNGNIYFTDPPYGLREKDDDPEKEIPFQGVYLIKPDGELFLLTDELSRPNGIALSPDEKTLYVANSDPQRAIWMAFDILEDGRVENGRLFFDATPLTKELRGLPDGLKVDQQGNLFATGPGGVLILSPDGQHLGTIFTTQATANCAFGKDGQTLFMTADMYLLAVPILTTGVGF
ncbi:MAG: SMP-30/gluconolactonase/LRE family protein [Bacteroidota bacterium]